MSTKKGISYITPLRLNNKFPFIIYTNPKKTRENIFIFNAKSIFEAYNLGIKESNFGVYCFLHDDTVILNKPEFEEKVYNIFSSDSTIGLIGVLGCKKLIDGLYWGGQHVGIINNKHKIFGKKIEGLCEEVEGIDGLLMVTNLPILFDEITYKGWDIYDLDMSRHMRSIKKKVVVGEFEIEHGIMGKNQENKKRYEQAIENRELYSKKWETK